MNNAIVAIVKREIKAAEEKAKAAAEAKRKADEVTVKKTAPVTSPTEKAENTEKKLPPFPLLNPLLQNVMSLNQNL